MCTCIWAEKEKRAEKDKLIIFLRRLKAYYWKSIEKTN